MKPELRTAVTRSSLTYTHFQDINTMRECPRFPLHLKSRSNEIVLHKVVEKIIRLPDGGAGFQRAVDLRGSSGRRRW